MRQSDRVMNALAPALAARRDRRRAQARHGSLLFDIEREVRVSDDSTFGKACRIGARVHVDRSTLGRFSYVDSDTRIHRARIGDFCSIATRVAIGPPNHPTEGRSSTHPAFYLHRPNWGYNFVATDTHEEYRDTIIGHDVWIGAGTTILGGVRIGNGCIVGAGAVVTRDLEPFSIAVGVPAKTLRKRFSERQIAALWDVSWWDREDQWLRENIALIEDIEALVAYSEGGA